MFASPVLNFGLFAPALSQRRWWNQPAEVFHRKRDQLDALMAEAITARRARAPGDDILWMLLDLSDAELNDELKTLLVAGHETTATSIAWAADLLAHHPEIADRVRAGDQAYRAAAAKEVLRLRTILPMERGAHAARAHRRAARRDRRARARRTPAPGPGAVPGANHLSPQRSPGRQPG